MNYLKKFKSLHKMDSSTKENFITLILKTTNKIFSKLNSGFTNHDMSRSDYLRFGESVVYLADYFYSNIPLYNNEIKEKLRMSATQSLYKELSTKLKKTNIKLINMKDELVNTKLQYENKLRQTARYLKLKKVNSDEISSITGLSVSEIEQL